MKNMVTITLHDRKFELWPPCPEVISVAEEFIMVLNTNANTKWQSITVKNFIDDNRNPVAIDGPNPVLTPASPIARVNFTNPVFNTPIHCKYDLEYNDGTTTWIVDPTVRIRPVGT